MPKLEQPVGKARPAAILAKKAGRLSRTAVVVLSETDPRGSAEPGPCFSSSQRRPGPPAGPHSPTARPRNRTAGSPWCPSAPVPRGASARAGKPRPRAENGGQPRAARSEGSRAPGRRAKSGRALPEGEGDGTGRGGGRRRCEGLRPGLSGSASFVRPESGGALSRGLHCHGAVWESPAARHGPATGWGRRCRRAAGPPGR